MRAKFNVSNVVTEPYGEEVQLHAVYGGSTNAEDNEFANATPAGHLHITITNPKALGFFIPGESYYLDITKVNQ